MTDDPKATNEPKYQARPDVPLRPLVSDKTLTASGDKPDQKDTLQHG